MLVNSGQTNKQRHTNRHTETLTATLCTLLGMWIEIEQTDRCCSETESVTAQICSGRNRTEPHTQIRARCRESFTPQTRDVQILKCCVRISLQILTTDLHPHPPLPTQAPSRSRVSNPSEPGKLGHWRTISSCETWSLGNLDRTRPSALYYSICSLCSAGQLAECRAWVNDLRQSVSANFRGRAVRVSPWISRILADLRPPSAHLCRRPPWPSARCGESHAGTAIISATTVIWCRRTCHQTHVTREVNGRTRRCGRWRPRRRWSSGPSLQRTPRATDMTRNWSCRGRLFGYFRRQMTVVEIIITELHCLSNSRHRVDCSASYVRNGRGCTKWDRRDGFTKNRENA